MDAALVENWNDTVRPADEIWHLGDVAMGRLAETLEIVRRLHGKKYLVPGNHDGCWSGRKDQHKWTGLYEEAGFTLLPERTALTIGGEHALVCHFPYRGDSNDNDRHPEHRPPDEGAWLLHGHVHDRWQQRDRMINVGVDVWDYRPVDLATLSTLITANQPAAPS